MDYADIYKIAMEYFAPKRAALAAVLAANIAADVNASAHNPVTLIDVGAGDGTMMADTLDRLPPCSRESIDALYVEPDDSNFAELRGTFNRLQHLTGGGLISHETVEAYLEREPKRATDIFIMTHLLYHIPRAEWRPFLTNVFSAAAPGGTSYITLINADSDVYRLSGLDPEHDEGKDNAPVVAGYVFAHQLEQTLQGMDGVAYDKTVVPASYAVPQEDIDAFCNAPDAAALAGTKFAAFLGFVLRQAPEDIARNQPLVENFRNHFRQGLPLRSSETLFRAVRTAPPSRPALS